MPDVRRHIALFLPNFDGGGAERAFVTLARGLADLGHRVDLVAGTATGPLRAEISPLVRVVDLAAPRLVAALPGLVRYLRTERPERLYSALEGAGILAILARRLAGRRAVQVVPSIRNTLSYEARDASPKRRLILWLARWLYPSADAVLAVSQGVATDASKVLRLSASAITVVRNPTLTPEFRRAAEAPVGHLWFNPKSVPVIMGCGRLVPQKDFATLIEAFALVRSQRPCRLLVLGEGPLRSDLVRLADQRGVGTDVALEGFDANPYRFMARSDVFVLSSLFEGSPNVIVQALASGAPVVSTDCPSGPNEILVGVPRGRLVPVSDATRMAIAITAFLDEADGRPHPIDLPGFGYLEAAQRYLDAVDERLGRIPARAAAA
jgi:glycosyltransferase involved in cell wall biosynthesis